MITLAEKKERAYSFVCEDFGILNYRTIFLFNQNSQNIISTIIHYGNLIEKVDEMMAGDVIRIKQQIILDAIIKTEILIEGLLVLIHQLSENYNTIAKGMAYYENRLVSQIIENFESGKYCIQKILGLPNISQLPLEEKEKEFLTIDFSYGTSLFVESIKKVIGFYQKFKIVYLKSKHGLTLQLGNFDKQGGKNLENSSAIFYDIKRIKDMPPSHITVRIQEPIANLDTFNAVSVVCFGPRLVKEINGILSTLRQVITLIYNNNEIMIKNCGEGYLPYTTRDGRLMATTFRLLESDKDQKTLSTIWSKILPNMNTQEIELTINTKYTNPDVIESINKNTVTNMRIETPSESSA